eukprot:gene24092-biopygen17888
MVVHRRNCIGERIEERTIIHQNACACCARGAFVGHGARGLVDAKAAAPPHRPDASRDETTFQISPVHPTTAFHITRLYEFRYKMQRCVSPYNCHCVIRVFSFVSPEMCHYMCAAATSLGYGGQLMMTRGGAPLPEKRRLEGTRLFW